MSQQSNLSFYDQFAEAYQSVYAQVDEKAAVERWIDLLESLELVPTLATRSQSPLALIDVGCGPGWHLAAWSRQGFRTTGLEGSPAMLPAAQQNLRAPGLGGGLP